MEGSVTALVGLAFLLMPSPTSADAPSPADAMSRVPTPVARRYVATIAVDGYRQAPPLRGAVADARAVAQAFRDRLGFRTYAAGEPLSLHDADASKEAIEAFTKRDGPLGQLPGNALLVVYVSLHGKSRACEAAEDGAAPQACGEVLPHDKAPGDGFDVTTLLHRLNRLPVRHVLLLLDTCDSGMALGGLHLNRVSYAALRNPAAERKSRKVITAAALQEQADDGNAATGRRGRFAATLLDGLAGEADLFPDGNLLFVELAVYLQAEVTRRSLADQRTGKTRQQPEFGGFLSDARGSPSLGTLEPTREHIEGTLDTLMDEAKLHLDAKDARRAQGVLARYLLLRSQHVRATRRAVGVARALAARGKRSAAIERLDALRRTGSMISPESHAAIAYYQSELSRRAGKDMDRRTAEIRQATLDAGRQLDRRGRGALADGLGALGVTVGADHAAAVAARVALPLVEPTIRRAIASDAAATLTAASDVPIADTSDPDLHSDDAPDTATPPIRATEEQPSSHETAAEPDPGRPLPATRFRPLMLPIPPGIFTMGSPKTEVIRYNDERAHRVRLTRHLLMAETEVTRAQYMATVGGSPLGDMNLPVGQVSWLEAVRYCNELSARESLTPAYLIEGEAVTWNRRSNGYRLPTEAEWEYAARAGATGERYGALDVVAWHSGNSGFKAHEAKGKHANRWGLDDMLGNVWEWTWDRYEHHYPARIDGAPLVDPEGAPDGESRVIRGGSFMSGDRHVRAANREALPARERGDDIGFRPVRTLP